MALATTPQSSNPINTTTDPIRTNFVLINNAFEVNHYPYGTPRAGKHVKVDFPNIVTPSPSTAAGAMVLYTSTGAHSMNPELTVRRPSDGSIIQMTEGNLVDNNGYTYLPSGLFIQWGAASVPGTGTLPITFSIAFAALFQVYVTSTTPAGVNRVLATISNSTPPSNTGFTVLTDILSGTSSQVTPGAAAISWVAVGR